VGLRGERCSIELSPDRVRVVLSHHLVTVDVPAVVAIRYDGKKRCAAIIAFGEDITPALETPSGRELGHLVTEAVWYPPSEANQLSAAEALAHDGEIVSIWPFRGSFDPVAIDALLRGCVGTAVYRNAATLDWLVAHSLRKLDPCDVRYEGSSLSAEDNDRLVRTLRDLVSVNARGLRLNGAPLVIRGETRRLRDLPRDEKIRLLLLGPLLLPGIWLQRGWRDQPGYRWELLTFAILLFLALELRSVARWLRS
jgi:hypothetical protein